MSWLKTIFRGNSRPQISVGESGAELNQEQIDRACIGVLETGLAAIASGHTKPGATSMENIVKLTRASDVGGLLSAFSLGGWETRELVAAALGNICRDSKPDVDYDRAQMVTALQSIVALCSAETTGGTYRQNCIDHARMLLNRPELNQQQATEEAAPVEFTITDEGDEPVSVVKVNVNDLRAICISFTQIDPGYEEAIEWVRDLMKRWNPKIYESFEQILPDIEVRLFYAPGIVALSSNIAAVGNEDYPDCSTIVQTGQFDTYDPNGGAHITSAVLLATFWRSGTEPRTILAQGPELTLVPDESGSRPITDISRDPDDAQLGHGDEESERPVEGIDPTDVAKLIRAAEIGNDEAYETIKGAVQCGADVNTKNVDGNSLLHIAISHDNGLMVELLLALGADPNMTNADGMSAAEAALILNKPEAFRRLVAHGAA